ncbi:MAG: hypothetical protein ACTS6G_04775 [Candidatus Hodgkinia cicadicola]
MVAIVYEILFEGSAIETNGKYEFTWGRRKTFKIECGRGTLTSAAFVS